MKNLKELEQKYLELGKEIEALKKQANNKEVNYPIYCNLKDSSLVVKFTDLTTGDVVINTKHYKIGDKSVTWISHINNDVWQQLDVCNKTGFFNGQLVWCWDNDDTHSRDLKFYDAKNKCTYIFNGKKDGCVYDNYKSFEGNYPDWALEAFQTLEEDDVL